MSKSIKYALTRTLPMLIGFFPVGLAYGILMSQRGYNFLWSGLTSVVVLTGSLQYLMITFFDNASSIPTIIIMSLLLNSRHIFYGLSFIEDFRKYGPWKYFLIYSLADENYSLLCSYTHIDGVNDKLVNVLSSALVVFYWLAFSMLGGLIGGLITFDTTGIDFALTALFVVILIDQLKEKGAHVPAFIGLVSAILCLVLIGPSSFILPSLALTVAVLVLLRRRLGGAADAASAGEVS